MSLHISVVRLSTLALAGFAFTMTASAQSVNSVSIRSTPMAATSESVVPMLVRYDGVAARGSFPVSGASMTFLIYKEEKGGEPLWIETQNAAVDALGKYEVYLGSTYSSGLPPGLFGTGEARWLEVQVAGETPGPRVLLTSVPYALKAADAATLGGLPASAFALAGAPTSIAPVKPDGVTADATTNVTTTGGGNLYLPKFSGTSTVINSQIYDNGTSVGIGDVPNASAKLDVNGAMIMRGNMTVSRTGNATASKAFPSYGFDFFSNAYNSSTKATDNPYFQLQSEPTGNDTASPSATFNLLFSNNGSAPAETGFSINPNGTIHFASGQTFPGGTGTGTITGITAGTGLTGGGTSGNVTLKVDTTAVPTLSGTNSFTGSNTFVPSIYENLDVNIDNTNANTGQISPGLRFGSASGEGMASKRTSGGNQYGIDIYTGYTSRLGVNAAGQVSIGTGDSFDGSQLQVQGSTSVGGEFSGGGTTDSSGDGLGEPGILTTGANASTSAGGNAESDAGAGINATGGSASGNSVYTFAGDGGDFLGGTASNAGCCFEGGPGGDSPAPLPYTGNGIIAMGGFAATGQPGYGAVLIGGSTNTGTPAPGLYVISGTDQNSNQGASATFNGDVDIDGNLNVTGAVNSDTEDTRIDHPADPANKYLVHASVESSEMVNIYSGNITTDELGLATVQLPDWFEAENTDFRYQLTVLDERFAQAVVSKKIQNHQFTVRTSASRVEISWQVTGVRQDAWAKAHPLVVEEAKSARERGFYLHPELYGAPAEKQLEWGRNPAAMQQLEAVRRRRKTMAKKSPVARAAQVIVPSPTRSPQ